MSTALGFSFVMEITEHEVERDGEPCRVEGLFLKSRPATEGEDRFIYCEPSNANWDAQNERIFSKALAEAADHYLLFGNVDINHISIAGPKLLGMTFMEAKLYEIGRPVEVVFDGTRYRRDGETVRVEENAALRGMPLSLKAAIYRGEGEQVRQANIFWDSQTKQSPAVEYRPSVGGAHLERKCDKGGTHCTITKAVWNNVGLASQPFLPVNRTVKAVSAMPIEAFLKALMGDGGTDTAGLSGGASLRRESLGDRITYAHAATRFLKGLRSSERCDHMQPPISEASMNEHFEKCEGVDSVTARRFTKRLLSQVAQLSQPAAAAA